MHHKKLRALCESAIFTAMALALSYLKVDIAALGGSINLVMVPLIICAIRWGLGCGLGAGLVFGTLKFFLAGGTAVNWESMLLDYSLAYMFVGFAGLLRGKSGTAWLAALIGCAARFLVHFVSGVTIYAQYMPESFMELTMTTPALYSLLYNGSYMLPNTVLAILIALLLEKPLRPYLPAEKAAR